MHRYCGQYFQKKMVTDDGEPIGGELPVVMSLNIFLIRELNRSEKGFKLDFLK